VRSAGTILICVPFSPFTTSNILLGKVFWRRRQRGLPDTEESGVQLANRPLCHAYEYAERSSGYGVPLFIHCNTVTMAPVAWIAVRTIRTTVSQSIRLEYLSVLTLKASMLTPRHRIAATAAPW
jgi:hypothetical protein